MANPQKENGHIRIEGGYVLIARKIFESRIWSEDPNVLKLFIYLVGKARHDNNPKKYNGFEIKRGELVTSLSQISENNEFMKNGRLQNWSRAKVSRMLNLLQTEGYIKILSDTYGTHINVCNYDTYQKPDLYKSDTSETDLKSIRNDTETDLETNNNGKNGNNGNNLEHVPSKEVSKPRGKKNKITITEYYKAQDVQKYFNRDVNDKDINQFNYYASVYGKDVVDKTIQLATHKNDGTTSKVYDTRIIFGVNKIIPGKDFKLTEEIFRNAKMELAADLKIEEALKLKKVTEEIGKLGGSWEGKGSPLQLDKLFKDTKIMTNNVGN